MPILLWTADWLQDHYYYDRVIDQGVYCVFTHDNPPSSLGGPLAETATRSTRTRAGLPRSDEEGVPHTQPA